MSPLICGSRCFFAGGAGNRALGGPPDGKQGEQQGSQEAQRAARPVRCSPVCSFYALSSMLGPPTAFRCGRTLVILRMRTN